MCAPAMFLMAVQASWAWWGRHKASRFMAARGCCPSCGASLLSTTEDADGLVVCTECAAAWKLGSPAKCPRCSYDLAGAVGVDGVITCPECAERWPAATEHRSRHEAFAEHGSMLDDAGESVANRSNAKSRRIALRARSKDERERAGLADWLLSVGFTLCFMLLPALVGASLFWLADRYLSETVAHFSGAMLGYAIAASLLFFGAKLARRSRLNTCRRLSICPACDADMRGAPAGGDGLTPCPNCRAKWTLPPARDAHAPA
jgi:Zn-finger nucleic acid-binding protein